MSSPESATLISHDNDVSGGCVLHHQSPLKICMNVKSWFPSEKELPRCPFNGWMISCPLNFGSNVRTMPGLRRKEQRRSKFSALGCHAASHLLFGSLPYNIWLFYYSRPLVLQVTCCCPKRVALSKLAVVVECAVTMLHKIS
ncbi:hypothetical protein P692DRAFT_20357146, partial [Suillus brevipes Sb2]